MVSYLYLFFCNFLFNCYLVLRKLILGIHRYVKEGSTVSVMGVVRRNDNVLMIVPPQEPVLTGCQWIRCLLPTYVEGLILTSEDNQNEDVIAV